MIQNIMFSSVHAGKAIGQKTKFAGTSDLFFTIFLLIVHHTLYIQVGSYIITTLQSGLRSGLSPQNVCIHFMHEWRDIQFKVDTRRQILKKLFMAIHNWSLQRFSQDYQLVSHNTYIVWGFILYMSSGSYSLKSIVFIVKNFIIC